VQLQNELAKMVQLTPEELTSLLVSAPAVDEQAAQFVAMAPVSRDDSVQPPNPPKRTSRTTSQTQTFARTSRRSVTPLALRLLGLLLAHPSLAEEMGDQQLDVLEQGESLDMVLDLIILIQRTHAKHVGALIQGAEPGSDLEALLISVSADVMAQEELPHPQSEWEDALRRIEIENLKREQSELIASGENNLELSQKYQELSRRITRLISVSNASKAK